MIYRFPALSALIGGVALGISLGISPVAHAQSTHSGGGSESILISTPDGQSVSNALLPSAQAPQPQASASDAAGAQASISFNQSLPVPILRPSSVYIPNNNNRRNRDSTDPRKQMGVMTPAEMMGVQTVQQLFGVPDPDEPARKNPSLSNTNRFSSDSLADNRSSWEKILVSGSGNDSSARDTNSSSLSGGFFGNTPSESVFGNPKKDAEDSVFNTSFSDQPDGQQQSSAFDSAPPQTSFQVQSSDLAPNNPALSSVFNSSLSSPSPFNLPQTTATMPTVPQLPKLPSVSSGLNNYSSLSQPATPSWEPKPPPWLSSQPQLGTIAQRKF